MRCSTAIHWRTANNADDNPSDSGGRGCLPPISGWRLLNFLADDGLRSARDSPWKLACALDCGIKVMMFSVMPLREAAWVCACLHNPNPEPLTCKEGRQHNPPSIDTLRNSVIAHTYTCQAKKSRDAHAPSPMFVAGPCPLGPLQAG